MSQDAAEIRVYRAGDESEIIKGLNRTRGATLSLEDWSWSYPASPEGRPIIVAITAGTVVAHVGGVAGEFHLDGHTVPALGLADEFATAKATGSEASAPLSGRVLDRLLAELGGGDRQLLIYRLSGVPPSDGFAGSARGTAVRLPQVEVLVRSDRSRSPLSRLAYRAEPARDWEPRLDDLWRRIARFYPCAAVRDAATALHRHAGHPRTRRHRFLVFPRFSPRPAAFAVFETDASRCRWVDLVWDHDEPGALDLVSHLSRRLANQVGATDERIVLGGDADTRNRLQAAGFRTDAILQNLSLKVYSLPADFGVGDLEGRWYVTQTDLDPLRRLG